MIQHLDTFENPQQLLIGLLRTNNVTA